MTLLVRCQQCGHDFEARHYDDNRRRCCFDCRSARELLYRYWRSIGLSVSQHKPHRTWLIWERTDVEEETRAC